MFWDKKSRRWRCQLGHKNRKIFLGYFAVAEAAARAYDQKLVELHGGSGEQGSIVLYVILAVKLSHEVFLLLCFGGGGCKSLLSEAGGTARRLRLGCTR